MREMTIVEFKAMVDGIAATHPTAKVAWVYPARHAGRETSRVAGVDGYYVSWLLDDPVIRFRVGMARDPEPPQT